MKTNIERYHWRHYFGGAALIMLILQLVTGTFLALFYQPDLQQAYASVQGLYQDFTAGAWIRDGHRWLALLIFAAIIVHTVRVLLRKDFLSYVRRTSWLTGVLLLLPVLAMFVTGYILPWEWKAYWFMEMVPNYLGSIPLIGPALKAFLIDTFTLSRNFIAHVVILPVITYILIDIHILAVLRRRRAGIGRFLARHAMLSTPFVAAAAILAVYIPMPSEDPNIIPMPLEGANIPTPEWVFLFLLRPFQSFDKTTASIFAFYLPLIVMIVLIALPYVVGRGKNAQLEVGSGEKPSLGVLSRALGKLTGTKFAAAAVSFAAVFFVASIPFGALYVNTHESPTMGCNSCHNILMGTRMGIPPKSFKDRKINPLVDNNRWMVEHWFYPQVAW